MTEMRALVADLARIEDGPPIITLYLDVHWRDEQQRERVRLFVRDEYRKAKEIFSVDPDAWAGLSATFDRINDWIDRAVNQDMRVDARGALLVASAPRDLFIEAMFGDRLTPTLFIDRTPRVFPLIELLSLQRPVYLATVDSTGADILDWGAGEIAGEHEVERLVPRRHHRGGWSQRHFERHIRRTIRYVWKECVSVLGQLVEPDADIILFGTEENLRQFERLLPQSLVNRVIGMRPEQSDRLKLLESARQVLDDEHVAREFALVHRILRQALSERSGTAGLEETLLALNQSRVKVLAISSRFNPPGFRCTNCRALSLTGASGCVFCGAATVSTHLREDVARRCISDGGELVVVPDGGPLDAYQGVGALLRQVMGPERRQHPVGVLRETSPTVMP